MIEWHLVKKKISNRIDVERPEEDILLRYRENSHEPLPNYAEDHILNTVRDFRILTKIYSRKPWQSKLSRRTFAVSTSKASRSTLGTRMG